MIPFFWLALFFDYKALENVMITLSKSHFVGYPIPELFGASRVDSIVSQVFRMKMFFSLALLTYSIFFLCLSSVEENTKRLNFLFRGISVPLFVLLVLFWLKFLNEDHIIIKSDKTELYLVTTFTLVFSIFLYSYSFRSKKRTNLKIRKTLPVNEPSNPTEPILKTIPNIKTESKENPEVDSSKEGEVKSENINDNLPAGIPLNPEENLNSNTTELEQGSQFSDLEKNQEISVLGGSVEEKIDQGGNSINTSILSNDEDGSLAPDQEEDNLAGKILEQNT
jgi:hypothetical protein|tara:strand:+ start:1448 stop:2287 length:840 start_codon:yes stop_codon:yes gene_type:complete